MENLASRINIFLDKYAGLNPNYDSSLDDISEKFTSPDASILKCCADLLDIGIIPQDINSSWESCGYLPYNSIEGRIEHDSIINELNILKHENNNY